MILALLAGSALRSTLLGGAGWILLKCFGVRRPDVRMTVWTVVLAVSLAMPALMPWMRIPLLKAESASIWAGVVLPLPLDPMAREARPTDSTVMTPTEIRQGVGEWRTWAIVLYGAVAGILSIRILLGLTSTHRVVRSAPLVRDHLTDGLTVRASRILKSPATFGSTIILPADHGTWGEEKRVAVLLHEWSHVANRDFYVLLMASVYRALFWFNPFAWWLLAHLSDLAEMVADDAAARGVGDRRRYAEILLDLARGPTRRFIGLAMAREGTVEWRVQRLWAMESVLAPIGNHRRTGLAIMLVPIAVLSAATLTRTAVPPNPKVAVKAATARRVAAAPDRFLRQTALPGGAAALREELSSLCCGTSAYGRIGATLSDRLHNPYLHVTLARFGSPREIAFLGVGPGGFDLYEVRFDHGAAQVAVDFAPDGTLEDLILRPQGDATQGAVVDCAQAASLPMPQAPIPIQVGFANRSGAELALYSLEGRGEPRYRAVLPDGGTTTLTTGVNQPLLVSDRTGRCLDIVLPGQITRSNIIGPGGVLNMPRDIAVPEGAEILRQYLGGLRSATVLYDRMTPEAAVTLRGQESYRRAILDKLGELEELRFRGVNGLGEDSYRARFANGWADWHIAFRGDGQVSGIVLGPPF